jgi:hypothetical protein
VDPKVHAYWPSGYPQSAEVPRSMPTNWAILNPEPRSVSALIGTSRWAIFHNQRSFFQEGMIGTMDGDDERNPPADNGLRWPQGRLRRINGVTASIVAFAIAAVFLAGGSYGFAQHSTARPFQTVDWPDGLCIACLIIGLIFLSSLVTQTMRRTRARRSRVRHTGR